MCFLNKMDRMGANFYRCVEMIKKQLEAVPAILHLPIGTESDFVGVVDIVANTAVIWENEELGAKFKVCQSDGGACGGVSFFFTLSLPLTLPLPLLTTMIGATRERRCDGCQTRDGKGT